MASETDICNLALILMGETPIQSLDDKCKTAITLKAVFWICLEILLTAHRWNFATQRAVLAQLSQAPTFGYSYAFQLPTACLRVLGMVGDDGNEDPTLEYKIEGTSLLTNESSARIKYIVQIKVAGLLPPWFCEALAAKLGEVSALGITGEPALVKLMKDIFENQALPAAKAIDAQEDTPDQPTTANPWLEARV